VKRSYNWETFYGASCGYFNKGRHVKSVIIFPGRIFYGGDILMWHRLVGRPSVRFILRRSAPRDLERCRRQLMVQYGCCCCCCWPLHSTDGARVTGVDGRRVGALMNRLSSVCSLAINVSTSCHRRPALQPVTAVRPVVGWPRARFTLLHISTKCGVSWHRPY